MKKCGSELFVDELLHAGELRVIDEQVSPALEITEIVDRVSEKTDGGEALLFRNTGTKFPILINALGSENRMRIVLKGSSPKDVSNDIRELFKAITLPPAGILSQLSKIPQLKKFASWMPRRKSGRGICQEVVMNTPDLSKLPVLTCWPADGGPFITLPLVHTIDPATGLRNVGMYRMQLFNKDTTGMHWHIHKTGARHYREYKSKGINMPVAVALGGDPIYTYSATAPLPDGIDEYLLAGFLRKKSVELVKCLTQDIWVPADADFIIEGYIDTTEDLILEGPFGDHTGFYSLADYYPRFHVTTITHRKNAIYPATIVGIPPQEDTWIAKVTEEIFIEPIRLTMIPELADFHLPAAGVAHNIGLFSIKNDYPGQGRKTLNAVWGAGQMMFTKFGIVFDQDLDLRDYESLGKVVSEKVNPLTDLIHVTGPLDILDHSSDRLAIGGKLGIDASGSDDHTSIPKMELLYRELQALQSSNPSIRYIQTDLARKGISLIIVNFQKTHAHQVRFLADEIASSHTLSRVKFWVMTDVDVPDLSVYELAWIVGSHVDPARDCIVSPAMGDKNQGILFMDASRKTRQYDNFSRDWPNPVVMDDDTIKLVDTKWSSYGIGGFLNSHSKRYKRMMNGSQAVCEV